MESPHSRQYAEINARIVAAASRSKRDVPTLIAVSKYQPADAVEELYRLGHRDFGENYAQELLEKADDLVRRGCDGIRWHFIGHLQTNKVKMILPFVFAIHSVDSLRLASEISKRVERGKRLPVFLEVNIDHEESKAGAMPEAVSDLVKSVKELPGIELQGLMCIPESSSGGDAFRRLRELGIKSQAGSALSMGMTQDFEAAITEGATHIRIGTALFGERPAKHG